MERLGDYVKQSVLNFKLELCCFFASVRVGVLAFACLNVIFGCIILIALAEENFAPLLLQTLNSIGGDDGPNFVPTCIIAYAVELASNALLLCAIIREDLVLLRVYLYYALGVLTLAVMVYSVVFMALSFSLEFLIIASVGYQIYLILLVRSAMVEIKHATIKNGYIVNLKKNIDASIPSVGEKYSVVIETDGKKTPVASLVRKEVKVETVAKPEFDKDATLPVHLAIREEIPKAGLAKETTPVYKITKEVKADVNTATVAKPEFDKVATLPVHLAIREEIPKAGLAKETTPVYKITKEVKVDVNTANVAKPGVVKDATLPVVLAVKKEIQKAGPAKETPVHKITNEVIAKESTSKDGASKEVTNEGANKDTVKDVANKEVKKDENKNPLRSFFGRKDKVKESKVKLDKNEESKKD